MDIIIQDVQRAAERPAVIAYERLQAGDLVLSSPRRLHGSTTLIRTWQKAHKFEWDDSRWTHAAIYAGGGFVIEATPPVIRKIELAVYLADYVVRFRRSPYVNADLGAAIAGVALAKLGRPYSYFDGVKVRRPAHRKISRQEENAYNCASLYADSFNKVMNDENHELWTVDSNEIKLPAQLSRTEKLMDVPVGWASTR